MTELLKFDENYKPTDLTSSMSPTTGNTKKTPPRHFIMKFLKNSDKANSNSGQGGNDMLCMEEQK